MRDIEQLTLEKYIEELAGAAAEGVGRCKTEKDVWAATEVCDLSPSLLSHDLMLSHR
jgi:hypothetical protein